jgi:DNA-binding transcriptional LysR family regulator
MAFDSTLTLRQIEIVRAIMVTGSISGAARLLNVTQPGISRALKHLESSLGLSLFIRQGGRYVPAAEARDIFNQVQEVYAKLENLRSSVHRLQRGYNVELSIGSVPSIAQSMVPIALAELKKQFPDIKMNVELLKIEEAIDYLMLRKGELACMSYKFEHPSIEFMPLARGTLVCIAERSHPLAARQQVSISEIAQFPLIGIEPGDPYGRIMAGLFESNALPYDIVIRARFGSTVIGLVKQNLGIAVLDSFTVRDLHAEHPQLVVIPITEKTEFQTFIAVRADIELSTFALRFIEILRRIMSSPK